MLPQAAGRGQHFQARGHSFSLYGPTLSRTITFLSFCLAVNWLSSGFVFATLSLNWLSAPLQTIRKIKKQQRRSERESIYWTKKENILKNRKKIY